MRSVDRKLVGLASALAALAALSCGAKSDRPADVDGSAPPRADAAPADAGRLDGAAADAPPPRQDAPPGNPNEATIVTKWKLAFVEGAAGLSCEAAGTPNVTIKSVSDSKATTTDKLSCAALMGASRVLAPGAYDVTIQLEDSAARAVSAVTSKLTLAGGANDAGDLLFQVQSFKLAWLVERNGAAVSCQAAGAATVELQAKLGGEMAVYKFPCADNAGETTAIRVGNYEVAVRLKDMAGETLSEVPAMMFPVTGEKRATFPRITFGVR
jgi:hypothetical protein